MVKLAYSILYVSDVTKSVEFYEKVFGFSRKFISPENDYAELITGETTLSFASLSLAKSNLKDGFIESSNSSKPFAQELGFSTANVQAVVDASIEAGAQLLESPKTKPWGQVVAYIRDIDGFLLEICTPMD